MAGVGAMSLLVVLALATPLAARSALSTPTATLATTLFSPATPKATPGEPAPPASFSHTARAAASAAAAPDAPVPGFVDSSSPPTEGTTAHGADHAHGHGHEGEVNRYPVATVEFARVETPFIIGLWIFCASLSKIGFHMAPKMAKIFPESCLLIVVGVAIGVLLNHVGHVDMRPLTPDTFFLYMLPPIILDAGYFMPNRLFFDHLGTILLFAVIGTVWNTVTIGASLWAVGQTGLFGTGASPPPLLHTFVFSALISAVDPVAVLAVFEEIHVNEILYIVVFGESLLNDAVTVVLYHMFEAYSEMGPENIVATDLLSGFASFLVVALGGTVIGVVWGFLTGLVTRYTHEVRVIEPIFIFVMAYLAYLNAEVFHMSGILAITFCGITMKNYVESNISHKSHTTIKYTMKMLSSSSETIIFMFLGVATVNDEHDWNTWFVFLTIIFCSVYRVIGVVILTAVANRFRLHQLTRVDKFVMSYGGLRGAVAFALVLLINKEHIPLQPMFVTTTIAVVYFTVFFQGITIKPLVRILNVKRQEKRKPTMNERIHERFMDHLMAGLEDLLGHHGNYHLRDKFKRFDNKFIRPLLLRDHQGAEPKILETYSKLAMKDAMEYMRRNASNVGNISNTESMSAIFRNLNVNGNLNGSFSHLDSSTWNIDMQELEYNPSKKDLTDARIHHLLDEELCKPYRRLYFEKFLKRRQLETDCEEGYQQEPVLRRRRRRRLRKCLHHSHCYHEHHHFHPGRHVRFATLPNTPTTQTPSLPSVVGSEEESVVPGRVIALDIEADEESAWKEGADSDEEVDVKDSNKVECEPMSADDADDEGEIVLLWHPREGRWARRTEPTAGSKESSSGEEGRVTGTQKGDHRRLSYSRHAVNDRDLATQPVNYRMHMNIRRMVGERKHHHKRSKRLNKDGKQNHVSFPGITQNGSAKQFSNDYLNDVLKEGDDDEEEEGEEPQEAPKATGSGSSGAKDDWESAITFTARTAPGVGGGRGSAVLTRIASLPGTHPRKARLIKEYCDPPPEGDADADYDDAPTVAEVSLPWRRGANGDDLASTSSGSGGDGGIQKKISRDSDTDSGRVTTPTATETTLPWKRDDDCDAAAAPIKQSEFPAWCANKEYLAYSSPSATFLGGIEQPKVASVIGLFRRESSGSVNDIVSDASGTASPASAGTVLHIDDQAGDPPGPTGLALALATAAAASVAGAGGGGGGRRSLTGRRGSMLELGATVNPIPEEEALTPASAHDSPSTSGAWAAAPLPGPPRRASAGGPRPALLPQSSSASMASAASTASVASSPAPRLADLPASSSSSTETSVDDDEVEEERRAIHRATSRK